MAAAIIQIVNIQKIKNIYHKYNYYINTHTINRVHYVHSYTPKYTCTEETQIINDDCGGCGMFR